MQNSNKSIYQVTIDWTDDNLPAKLTERDVVNSVARAARYAWKLPLKDYGVTITHVKLSQRFWPEITVQGPLTAMLMLLHCYNTGDDRERALKLGCSAADWYLKEHLLTPVRGS